MTASNPEVATQTVYFWTPSKGILAMRGAVVKRREIEEPDDDAFSMQPIHPNATLRKLLYEVRVPEPGIVPFGHVHQWDAGLLWVVPDPVPAMYGWRHPVRDSAAVIVTRVEIEDVGAIYFTSCGPAIWLGRPEIDWPSESERREHARE